MDGSEKKGATRATRRSTLGAQPDYVELGNWIRARREATGLQQKPVSRKMGKPEHFLNRVEAGRQRIDFIEFLELLAVIDPELEAELREKLAFTRASES